MGGGRKIGAFEAVPAMGLDGLGSSAYGPEAALTVLIPLGGAGLSTLGWVMAPIVALLVILFLSYWQTIQAYPSNGGAYIVAKENLGTNASLLAAAALMIDYVLNVAVGISAGVAALVSALPSLHPYILPLCLGILLLVTVVNLRGTPEAGLLFSVPTYLFVASFAAVIAIGLGKLVLAGGSPEPVVAPPKLPDASETVTMWLLLRSFAAGCTAMTGVEAVSNGMSDFKDPPVKHGHRTLGAIVAILGALLVGIAVLSRAYGVGAMDQTQDGYRSVLCQLVAAVVGTGWFYYVAIGSLLSILTLSANTSLVGFPRLCRVVAEDGFLPRPFAIAGRRLVYDVGMLYLAAASGLLLIVFGGITDHLIPLFAIGAFLTFLVSQTGMVAHWLRQGRDPEGAERHRLHLTVNLTGAVSTAVALAVVAVAKFAEGAWITVLVIPATILLLKAIRRYYDDLGSKLRQPGPLDLSGLKPPVILVAVERWNRITDKALAFALAMTPDVIALHLTKLAGPDAADGERSLREDWARDVEEPALAAGLPVPRLMMLPAGYRAIHEPVLRLVAELEDKMPDRRVTVLIPELVKQRWYQHLLHPRRARHLRRKLLDHGGTRLTVMDVPWHLDEVPPREGQPSAAATARSPSR